MLLVDAYNVIQTPGILPPDLAGLDVVGLADLIAKSRYARRGARLVCDGGVQGQAGGWPDQSAGIEVLFAGPGHEADDLIEQILRSDGGARGMLVVSSDRRVQRVARRRKARAISSQEFLAQLTHDQARRKLPPRPAFAQAVPLDRGSVAYWLREFGLDDGLEPATEAGPHPAGLIAAANGAMRPRPPVKSAAGPSRPPSGPLPPIEHAAAGPSAVIDPVVLEAMRMWPGQINPDDLDMNKWLEPGNGKQGDSRTRPRRG